MTSAKYLTTTILTGILAGGMLFFGVKPASAERDWSASCHDRLEQARARIDRDIQRHGENSRQVNKDRDKLEDTRRWCRDHHADWDHDRFDLGVYIRH
jgi:hypothetical protein